MGKQLSVQLGRHGTSLWAFKRMKEDALVALLDDLLEAGPRGLNGDQCESIKIALGKMVNLATQIPDGSLFQAALWKVMQKFEETYHSWNEPKEATDEAIEHRRKELANLRSLRHKIAKKTRNHGLVLEENLDLELIRDVYVALGNTVKSGPEIFKELAKAIRQFNKPKK